MFLHLRKTLGVALFGLALLPTISRADITFDYGLCNSSDGCDQSVNFSPANSGTTVIGNANPPAPFYNVYIDSLEGLTLHGSGSTVDTGGGPLSGFNSILIRPQDGYTWGAIEFQLDSVIGTRNRVAGGLTFTAYDATNVGFSFLANLPWEGNNGENQHYQFHAINDEVITSLQISYADPFCGTTPAFCNTIHDIHNIDVNTTTMIPEPETYAMLLAGLGLMGFIARRRKLDESA